MRICRVFLFLTFTAESKNERKTSQRDTILRHVLANVKNYIEILTKPDLCFLYTFNFQLKDLLSLDWLFIDISKTSSIFLMFGTYLKLQDLLDIILFIPNRNDNETLWFDYCKFSNCKSLRYY